MPVTPKIVVRGKISDQTVFARSFAIVFWKTRVPTWQHRMFSVPTRKRISCRRQVGVCSKSGAERGISAAGRWPQRIVSLLASGTEILYGLGLGDRVVAVSHECDFPVEVAGKPRVTFSHVAAPTSREIDDQVRDMWAAGRALYEIDAGTLTALAPDLIVTQAQCDVCAVKLDDVMSLVDSLPALARTRVVALNPMTFEDIFTDIHRVGETAGVAEVAIRYVTQLRDRVDAIRSATAALLPTERPRVAALEWIDPVMLAGNWMPEIIALAGGVQPLDAVGRHSKYARWDEIVEYDPQVVLVMPCGFDLARAVAESRSLMTMPNWSRLTAVREGRVFAVDGNAYFNRSGPRIIDSLELLAGLLHPRLFGWPTASVGETRVWEQLA